MDGREDVGRRLRPGPQAFHHELEDLARERVVAGVEHLAVALDGVPHEGFEIRVDLGLDEDPEHPEGASPEREGVPVAGGAGADAEDAGQGVEPLREGERPPGRGRGDRVARKARQVRFLDGFRDLAGFSVRACVAGAHVALEVGELADHGGDEVALVELRRAHRGGRLLRVEPGRARHVADEDRHPVGLRGHRAEPLLEHDPRECRPVGRQGLLPIGVDEERRVLEAGPDHPFVPGPDRLRPPALDVADGDEGSLQPAALVLDREVALVALQGGRDHPARKIEEPLFEPSGDRHRPLDEGGHLVEEVVPRDRPAAEAGRRVRDESLDEPPALAERGEHPTGTPELLHVFARVGEGDRVPVMKAVAAGVAPGPDPEDGGLDDLGSEEQHDPVNRPHELRVAVSPAHATGDRKLGERRLDHVRDEVRGGARRLLDPVHEPGPLGGLEPVEIAGVHPAGAGEAEGGPGRLPVAVERGREGRPPAFARSSGDASRNAARDEGEPAGGGEGLDRAAGETDPREPLAHRVRKRFGEAAQALRRELLGADLSEEVAPSGLSHRPPPSRTRGRCVAAGETRAARAGRARLGPRRA